MYSLSNYPTKLIRLLINYDNDNDSDNDSDSDDDNHDDEFMVMIVMITTTVYTIYKLLNTRLKKI